MCLELTLCYDEPVAAAAWPAEIGGGFVVGHVIQVNFLRMCFGSPGFALFALVLQAGANTAWVTKTPEVLLWEGCEQI